MGYKNFGYKKGDRVAVIGVSGYGTVVEDQGHKEAVQVKWDDSRYVAWPLAANLTQVGWTQFPPKQEVPAARLEAIKLIEEKRDELVKERNSLNNRIIELDETIKLLVD